MVNITIRYVLLTINIALIIFLLIVRLIIGNNYLHNDDIFLGQTFVSFQMDYAASFKYIISFFVISAIMSLFFRCDKRWKIIIICLSFLGLICYSYSQ